MDVEGRGRGRLKLSLEFAVETEDDHETRFVAQLQTRNRSANVRNSIESFLPQPLDSVGATS